MRAPQFRLQKRPFLVKHRAFGGAVWSWGKWQTVASRATLEEAVAVAQTSRGLYQWRVLLGTVTKWERS